MLKYSKPIELVVGTSLNKSGQVIENVYFPVEGFISQLITIDDVGALEIGLIGSEGMLGATLLLGEKASPVTAVVHGSGSALSMSSLQFCRAIYQNPILLRAINQYLFKTIRQWTLSAFCGHYHQTTQRLARFLLMIHDRRHHSTFSITQETLAKLLGVRRSSITVAASELQRNKKIRYCRGEIEIIDRPGLEAVACQCYPSFSSR